MSDELSGRSYPRRRQSGPCRLTWQERQILGTLIDVSYAGPALALSGETELKAEGEGLIHIPDAITLRARPVYIPPPQGEDKRARLELDRTERGEELRHTLRDTPR